MLLLQGLAPLLAVAVPPTSSCSTDPAAPLEAQCGGNGQCTSDGVCACHRPWTGTTCERLDFLPAAARSACLSGLGG